MTLRCGRYCRNTDNEAVVFADAGRIQLMPRGLLGAAPGSAPPHAAAPGNSRTDCRFGPSAGSGASPHVWLAGQPALDPMAPLDDAASAIYSAFLVAEEGTASAFRAGSAGVVGEHGLPLSLDTDRGAHYIPAPAGGRRRRPLAADTARPGAHARLCVVSIAAYSPHTASASMSVASGGLCAHAVGGLRDWRVFQTLQDRLVKELARKASPSIGPSR